MQGHDFYWSAASSLCIFTGVFLAVRWCGPVWDALSLRVLGDFVTQMRNIGLDTTHVPMYLRWWGAALLMSFFVTVFVLRIPVIGIVLVGFVFVLPRYCLEYLIVQRRGLLRDQMVGASVALANAARAGLALPQGLESISLETPQPLAGEFRRIVQDYGRGRPLPETLRDAKDRLVLDGFTLFTSALLTCLDRGGKVTEALERISKSLQESQRLERKLDADTASGRKVVIILTSFPLVFLLGFYAMDPGSVGVLFQTVVGQLVIVAVLGLTYLAALWAKKILTIDL